MAAKGRRLLGGGDAAPEREKSGEHLDAHGQSGPRERRARFGPGDEPGAVVGTLHIKRVEKRITLIPTISANGLADFRGAGAPADGKGIFPNALRQHGGGLKVGVVKAIEHQVGRRKRGASIRGGIIVHTDGHVAAPHEQAGAGMAVPDFPIRIKSVKRGDRGFDKRKIAPSPPPPPLPLPRRVDKSQCELAKDGFGVIAFDPLAFDALKDIRVVCLHHDWDGAGDGLVFKKIEQAALSMSDGLVANRLIARGAGEIQQTQRRPIRIPIPKLRAVLRTGNNERMPQTTRRLAKKTRGGKTEITNDNVVIHNVKFFVRKRLPTLTSHHDIFWKPPLFVHWNGCGLFNTSPAPSAAGSKSLL